MGLAQNILASEKAMDKLSKIYADYYRSDSLKYAKGDMVYMLEQDFGLCMRPATISSALDSIMDKIQEGARKYGYNGPIIAPKKADNELSDYLKKQADIILANDEIMYSLGMRWYYLEQDKGRLVKGAAWSKSYWGSYPNMLVDFYKDGVYGLGYISFDDAKKIAKSIMKEIKAKGKEYAMLSDEERMKKLKVHESKEHNAPKTPLKAMKKASRDEDIKQHGKSTAFRPTITKNKKKYDRKKEKAVALNEMVDAIYERVLNEIRKYGQIVDESKWDEDEIRAQIEREGGMSWTDEDLGLKFYIRERKSSKDGQPVYVVYDKDDNMVAASRYLEKAQRSLYNNVVVALEQDDFDMGVVRQNDIDESLGYDMNTPEGREGAMKWMRHVISQEDPGETAAREWAEQNGFYDDENIISAFMAGIEYGRNY